MAEKKAAEGTTERPKRTQQPAVKTVFNSTDSLKHFANVSRLIEEKRKENNGKDTDEIKSLLFVYNTASKVHDERTQKVGYIK